MIDIRQIVGEIVKARAASDELAYALHVHKCVREYGQQLLGSIASALQPTTTEEIEIVNWLHKKLVDMMQQIPQPKESP